MKQYNPAIDILRIISILAVILIHTSSRVLEVNHFDLKSVPVLTIANQLSRFAVPLFFMISGFVLELSFSVHQNFWLYIKKRFSKILLPYLFWSLFYYFFIYTHHDNNLLRVFLSGSASYQLYFIPALLIFYLIFPLLRKIQFNKYLMIFLGILQILLLYIDYKYFGIHINFPIRIALLNLYVFLVGIVAFRHQTQLQKLLSRNWPISLITTILCGTWVVIDGFSRYYQTFNFEAIYSQWRPSIFLYTLSIAAFGLYFFSKLKFPESLVKKIASLSFFVFFVHTWILELLWKNNLHWGLFASVTIVSFTIAFMAHKIPYLNKVTG